MREACDALRMTHRDLRFDVQSTTESSSKQQRSHAATLWPCLMSHVSCSHVSCGSCGACELDFDVCGPCGLSAKRQRLRELQSDSTLQSTPDTKHISHLTLHMVRALLTHCTKHEKNLHTSQAPPWMNQRSMGQRYRAQHNTTNTQHLVTNRES